MKRLRLSLSVLTLVSLWSLTATRTQAASLPTCTSSITACCEITAAGTYVVTSPLTSTDPAADCIDINSANVNLFDAGNAITGPGSGATGVGINVLKKAKNAAVLLADPSPNSTTSENTISGFGTGIEVAADATVGAFIANNNVTNGVFINGAKNCQIYSFSADNNSVGVLITGGSGCAVHDFEADSNSSLGLSLSKAKSMKFFDFETSFNAGSGMSLDASSSNTFYDFNADNNSVTGIFLNSKSNKNYLANFDASSNPSGSGITVQSSSSNQLVDFDAYDNGVYGVWLVGADSNTVSYFFTFGDALAGVYLGCSTTGPNGCSSSASSKNTLSGGSAGNDGVISQSYGVAVDTGDLKNTLTGIGAAGDTTTDLFDNNAN